MIRGMGFIIRIKQTLLGSRNALQDVARELHCALDVTDDEVQLIADAPAFVDLKEAYEVLGEKEILHIINCALRDAARKTLYRDFIQMTHNVRQVGSLAAVCRNARKEGV